MAISDSVCSLRSRTGGRRFDENGAKDDPLPILSVRNFSCIDAATLELKPITLLIGPQASGKSVLTKLCYFFTDIVFQQYDFAEQGLSLERFRSRMAARFEEWFPPSAWGKKRFRISYESGSDIRYSIERNQNSKRADAPVEITFSAFFEDYYKGLLEEYKRGRVERIEPDEEDLFGGGLERLWRVRSSSFKQLTDRLKGDFIRAQTFIPAGRSLFTNLGKAVAILEHGKQMDEITRSFGRIFTSLIDGQSYWWTEKPDDRTRDFLSRQKERLESTFGGKIRITQNDRHVATDDGRRVPFSVLSSGQQEILPLLLILQHKARSLAGINNPLSKEIIYVEEPEAHLFPKAQGELVEYIAATSAFFGDQCFFLITTLSPYVISKFNNLLKAFVVGTLSEPKIRAKVPLVVERDLWLPPASVNAYALQEGQLKSVNDKSGLIDGAYLDGISEDISETFLSLLEIETENDRFRMSLGQRSFQDKIGREWKVGDVP